MGYLRNHAIVVSGSVARLTEAHAEAEILFDEKETSYGATFGALVSPILGPLVNGVASFFIAPDGSKEWWDESDSGDEAREEFVTWLRAAGGPGYLDWVEVQYGDDEMVTRVVRHSDEEDPPEPTPPPRNVPLPSSVSGDE